MKPIGLGIQHTPPPPSPPSHSHTPTPRPPPLNMVNMMKMPIFKGLGTEDTKKNLYVAKSMWKSE